MASKRSKSKNYTEAEKQLFLNIVESKKDIVECKVTNATTIKRKQEAWESITEQFNTFAEMRRDVKQLKTLYENCKRKARKDVAEENRAQYEVLMNVDVEEDAAQAIHVAKEEARLQKIEIFKTGGGGSVPEISCTSQQILGIMGGNIKPNANMYDSAADYYNDMEPILLNEVISVDPNLISMPIPPEQPTPLNIPTPKSKPVFRALQNKRKTQKNVTSEALKKMYFKQKLRNAQYEAMTQKNLFKLQRQSLMWDLKIKKKQYDLLLKNDN